MNKKELKEVLMGNTKIYIEAKNDLSNNKQYPQPGFIWVNSFYDSITDFILKNDLMDWIEIPDVLVSDDIERRNFRHFIKWSEGITPITK